MYQLMGDLIASGVPRELVFHFTFDDDRLEPLANDTASQVLEAYFRLVPQAREGCYLLFDEIQDLPNWTKFVRRISEQHETTIVLTGSSSKLLSRDIPSHLRGRSLATEMWPLSFKEFCAFRSIDRRQYGGVHTAATSARLEAAFADYLEVGGFPAVQQLGAHTRIRMLQTYASEILTKDVVERFGTTSLRIAERFARNALRSTGLRFSVNAQLKDIRRSNLSVSDERLYALLDDLEDSHLVFRTSSHSLSIKENPKAAYRVYSVDAGLALAVAPAGHLDRGQRLETAVYVELKRRSGSNRLNAITSYSGEGCPEVDFLVGDVELVLS